MPSPCTSDPNEPLHPFVMLLKIFLKEEGRLEKLDAAVKASIAEEIFELKDWNITNGEDFLHFASCLLKHWIPSENQSGTFVYQVCTVFYWIFNHAELNDLQTVMKPSSIKSGLPDVTPVSQWIVGYAHLMGEWFDQPNSITPESYASFWQAKSYRMEDYLIPNPGDEKVGGFTSFNEFFCRFLKEKYPYPNVRPIAEINDPNVVISPADAIFDGHWAVDQQNNVKIKTLEWPISALLHGCPPQYIDKFKGGTWCHSFLNTFNYHRQHAPVAGKVRHASVIPGLCYLEVVKVKNKDGKTVLQPQRPIQDKHPRLQEGQEETPYAPDHPGYQFMQRRGCIIIDTEGPNGLVAVLPIGMFQVSSINLSVKTGDVVKKGEEISWFEFGGSDIVLVFEKKAKAEMFVAKNKARLMGEELCRLQS